MSYSYECFKLPPYDYRKVEFASPDWPTDFDLEYMQVVAAPFGGPLAAIRDAKKFVPVQGPSRPMIRIFDTSGRETGHILWNYGKLISMGWSDTEELICVLENAKVFVFDMFGTEQESYTIGDEAKVKIVKAKVYQSVTGTGVAVLTKSGSVFLKLNSDKTEQKLPDLLGSSENCSCWEIVTEGRNSYCLLGREREVIKLMHGQTECTITANLFEKPYDRIILMSVSHDHQHLALYTNTGLLWLGSVDMSQKYCEFDTDRMDLPLQIEWIMNTHSKNADAVVISYPSFLLIVNRNACKKYEYINESTMILVAEIDGVRIITQSSHEMVKRLPKCVQNIFELCSQEPATYLFAAQKSINEKEKFGEALENLNQSRFDLELAVNECIEAAAYEFCPETQKTLIRAAYLGKSYIRTHNPKEYMRILRTLRVLNTLRHEKIAMPLTYSQFSHLKPEVILSRLVLRKHYAVAVKVAQYLKLPESWILEHWAYHQVVNDPNDNEVARKITEKLNDPPVQGISFCNIANKAYESGREELAMKMLELESRATLHVPLLIKMGKFNRALASATQSGDTELVTWVLLEIKKKMTPSNFQVTIREDPMALNMHKKVMTVFNRTALCGIYNMEDNHKSIAEYHLYNAMESENLASNLSLIGDSYALGRFTVEVELCADTARLLKYQRTLTEKHNGQKFNGLSIHDTILQLLKMDELKEAEKMKKDYKVPDRRFWWLRIITLSEKQNWLALEKFSKSKKSPVGYEPFVQVCLQQDNAQEARKYIPRCPEQRRVHWYLKSNLPEEAINYAIKQRDLHGLYYLQKNFRQIEDLMLLEKLCNAIALLEAKL